MSIAEARALAIGARPLVTGVVTVEPGRLLNERTIVIQDGSAGIFVRLPEEYPFDDVPRGRIVQVRGELSAPYGNLEMRPLQPSDVVPMGAGGLPVPVSLGSHDIDEAAEGLLATLDATVVSVEQRSGGAFSITVRDGQGTAQVYVHAGLGLESATIIQQGQQLAATGIVGQRASGTGAADGSASGRETRTTWWPQPLNLPRATPRPDPGPPGGQPPRGRPPRGQIGRAAPGDSVTIVGTVTSSAGLIDSEGRRVTVEDRSGAILVRYPDDARPARVGTLIRASGEVGTWYDGRQLEAEETPQRVREGRAVPTILRRPPDSGDEWQLVAVTVRIADVERDGDAWRAEATLGAAGDLPIVGLAASGTSADGLEPGRAARIVGIVKRAHPSASDQRFAIAPRSAADIELGDSAPGGDPAGPGATGGAQGPADPGRTGVAGDWAAPATTLDALATLADEVVRIGGRVTRIDGRRLTLDDGTAAVDLRLAAAVEPFEPGLQVDEVLNVVGRVRGRPGRLEVMVRSSADVRRAVLAEPAGEEAPAAATSLASGRLPDGMAAPELLEGPAVPSDAPPLLPLALVLAGLAVLLVGGAVVSLSWPRLGGRWHLVGRVSPGQTSPQRSDPPQGRHWKRSDVGTNARLLSWLGCEVESSPGSATRGDGRGHVVPSDASSRHASGDTVV